jgi:hypothetical protein
VIRVLLLMSLMFATACGRPLTESERSYLSGLHGTTLDTKRMRLVHGAPVVPITYYRSSRPRLACRERILPPAPEEVVTGSPAAVALFNRIFFTRAWYTDNYLPEYPNRLHLVEAMLLAHEATHVWQWQNRKRTGYHPLRAAAEHGGRRDPYLFDLDEAPDFLSYGYEQQGAIIEEYVCCRALAPQAARTRRLHAMLTQHMPVRALPQSREQDVYLPWQDADLRGICD